MGFGPFRGTVTHSEKRDFIWVWLQELLPSESTWEALIKKGLNLCTGPAVMPEPALRMALSRQPEELLPGGDQAGVRAGGAGNVRVDACNRRRGLEGKGPFAAWRD